MRYCYTLIFTLIFSFTGLKMVLAQGREVTGVVQTSTGEALPGATVIISGTNSATITDADGKFSITAQNGQTLRVTFIGYLAPKCGD